MLLFLQQFCNSLDYYDQMTEQCASTCNRCPNVAPNATSTCVDYAKDCISRIGLCSIPQYDGLMHRACAKTCNKCNGCYDNSNSCQQWAARGFCTSNQNDRAMKMKYCARTCSLC
ncbi:shTK domain protein [Oesophagostomum dentatum]|uniref:ShTK domain protein n=1 Tax=Oesophagostomum dentatum TaxID=61180 RepID=A0A0B1SSF5_OESDE|nr:shTK domain protein [Oesophagostomum dentatum]